MLQFFFFFKLTYQKWSNQVRRFILGIGDRRSLFAGSQKYTYACSCRVVSLRLFPSNINISDQLSSHTHTDRIPSSTLAAHCPCFSWSILLDRSAFPPEIYRCVSVSWFLLLFIRFFNSLLVLYGREKEGPTESPSPLQPQVPLILPLGRTDLDPSIYFSLPNCLINADYSDSQSIIESVKETTYIHTNTDQKTILILSSKIYYYRN